MDEITVDRLISDFEGVINQINEIVRTNNYDAAVKAMEQIAKIVAEDHPEIQLDDRDNKDMDHVLHDLLSQIHGVVTIGARAPQTIYEPIDTTDIENRITDIKAQISAIDGEFAKSTKSVPDHSEELGELNRQLEEARKRRREVGDRAVAANRDPNKQEDYPRLRAEAVNLDGIVADLENQIAALTRDIDKEIQDVKAQIEALKDHLEEVCQEYDELENYDDHDRTVKILKEYNKVRAEIKKLVDQLKKLEEEKNRTNSSDKDKNHVDELNRRKKELEDQLRKAEDELEKAKKGQAVVIPGKKGETLDLEKRAKEIGEAIFKTHKIRIELERRGVTRDDFLAFYKKGLEQITERQEKLKAEVEAYRQEVATFSTDEKGNLLYDVLRDPKAKKETKRNALKILRSRMEKDKKFRKLLEEAGITPEMKLEEIEEKLTGIVIGISDLQAAQLEKYRREAIGLVSADRDLRKAIRTIEREKKAIDAPKLSEKKLDRITRHDIDLREKQIRASMFGDEELEETWDNIISRFYRHRQNGAGEATFIGPDGKTHTIKYDLIEDYEGKEFDAHWLNIDKYDQFLRIVSAYEAAETEYKGGGLDYLSQNLDQLFEDNPKFEDAYKKALKNQTPERANALLRELIKEQREYVLTFHGQVNREAVKYAALKTAGSSLTAMRPVGRHLPTPVRLKNATSNVFRFLGLRAPSFHKIDADGKKVVSVGRGLGTLATDALVVGAATVAAMSGPIGLASLGAAYAVRGGVVAGNVIAGNRFYKKHKDVIDANLPTLAEPRKAVKEVARRDYYRQDIMERTGKAKLSPFRMATTYLHAKLERLPGFSWARENTEEDIVSYRKKQMEKEVRLNIQEMIEADATARISAETNQLRREANYRDEALGQTTYNSTLRNPDGQLADDRAQMTAVNAELRSRDGNIRVGLDTGEAGLEEDVSKSRYVKKGSQLTSTMDIEDVTDITTRKRATMTENTAVTPEQHYRGETEHRDYWNRVITLLGSTAAGVAIRGFMTKAVRAEGPKVKKGTEDTQKMVHHDAEYDRRWVPGERGHYKTVGQVEGSERIGDLETDNVVRANVYRATANAYEIPAEKAASGTIRDIAIRTPEYGDTYGTPVNGLDDSVISFGLGGAKKVDVSITIPDDLDVAGLGDVMLSQKGFANWVYRMREAGLITSENPTNVEVARAALENGLVYVNKRHGGWQLVTGVTPGEQVWVPGTAGHWTTGRLLRQAWDEAVTVPGTPDVLEPGRIDVDWDTIFTPEAIREIAPGVLLGDADRLHEASKSTARTAVDLHRRTGGDFVTRNPLLDRNYEEMRRIIRDKKAKEHEASPTGKEETSSKGKQEPQPVATTPQEELPEGPDPNDPDDFFRTPEEREAKRKSER